MTREQEINNVSENYGNEKYSDGVNSLICAEDFQNGAYWADQHPRKGLWDAEKVIEWLDHYADSYTYFSPDKQETGFIGQMFNDLRKAMEE